MASCRFDQSVLLSFSQQLLLNSAYTHLWVCRLDFKLWRCGNVLEDYESNSSCNPNPLLRECFFDPLSL